MIIGNPISTGLGDAIYILTIITSPGANISAVLDDQIILKTANSSGVAVLRFRKEGTWTITATDGINTKTITLEVSGKKAETITFFPAAEPSAYSLIGTYTANQTWEAPEDGYFQVEVFGASGSGGAGQSYRYTGQTCRYGAGGGGGGGGYACSRVKLNKGDTIILAPGVVGSTSSAIVNSSIESYDTLEVTSGMNGGAGTATSRTNYAGGAGGSGGTASGGNYANYNGKAGDAGLKNSGGTAVTATPGAGGTAGYTGGNTGGIGGSAVASGSYYTTLTAAGGAGGAGFIKIYRGDTNAA